MVGPTNKEYRFSYKNILGSLESLRSDYIFLRVFLFLRLSYGTEDHFNVPPQYS